MSNLIYEKKMITAEITKYHDQSVRDKNGGYESDSIMKDPFSSIIEAESTQLTERNLLKASRLNTPLGPMMAIADEQGLYLLDFVDRKGLKRVVERLKKKTKSTITVGQTQPLRSIENELKDYFKCNLTEFKTPLIFLGSSFQKRVWEELKKIPFGKTQSYSDIAAGIEHPTAFRAVANANGANPFVIIVPCHRVINANGELGGYGGGLTRKKWLIHHEKI